MKKGLLTLLFATMLSVSLCACGGADSEKTRSSAEIEDVEDEDDEDEDEDEADEEEEVVEEEAEEAAEAAEAAIEESSFSVTCTTITPLDGDSEIHLFDNGYAIHIWDDSDIPTNTIYVYDMLGQKKTTLELEYDMMSEGYGCWYFGAGSHYYTLAVGMAQCGQPETFAILDENNDIVRVLEDNEELLDVIDDGEGNAIFVMTKGGDGSEFYYYDAETGKEREYSSDFKFGGVKYIESDEWDTLVESNNSDYLFAGNDDEWAYLDKDQNVLASYLDATEFNAAGYALVSDNRETYYVIDKDFNALTDSYIEGMGAYYYRRGDYFVVSKDNGEKTLVMVE